MTTLRPIALFLALAAFGCNAPPPEAAPTVPSPKPDSSLRDPYTLHLAIVEDAQVRGYLIRYDPIPGHSDVQRSLPAGTCRILGLELEELGFVTPHGEFRRYTLPGESKSLGHHGLEEGLGRFFAATSRIELVPLGSLASPAPSEPGEADAVEIEEDEFDVS